MDLEVKQAATYCDEEEEDMADKKKKRLFLINKMQGRSS